MQADVEVYTRGAALVVAVRGEMDLAAVPRLRPEIVHALASPPAVTVLDLGLVDFIDSAGLGVVLGVLRRVRQAAGELRVAVAEPQVRAVFELTGLDGVVALHASVDAALASPDPSSPEASPREPSEPSAVRRG